MRRSALATSKVASAFHALSPIRNQKSRWIALKTSRIGPYPLTSLEFPLCRPTNTPVPPAAMNLSSSNLSMRMPSKSALSAEERYERCIPMWEWYLKVGGSTRQILALKVGAVARRALAAARRALPPPRRAPVRLHRVREAPSKGFGKKLPKEKIAWSQS